jgi:hypothetical protein
LTIRRLDDESLSIPRIRVDVSDFIRLPVHARDDGQVDVALGISRQRLKTRVMQDATDEPRLQPVSACWH